MHATSQRRSRRIPALLIAVVLLLTGLPAATPAGAATEWEIGDIFLGVHYGVYQVHAPDGTLKDTLSHTSINWSATTGCALDTAGNFYGTWNFANTVARFAAVSPHAQSDFVTEDIFPQDVAFDESGNLFVGSYDIFSFEDHGIRMYDPSGAYIRTITTEPATSLAIAIDGDTILYTQQGTSIKRVSISSGAPLPDFTTDTAEQATTVRVLQDGTVLLTDNATIKRYDAAGTVIQTYDIAEEDSGWYGLALDPDGESFWAGDFVNSIVYKFDIDAGGAPLTSFDSGADDYLLYGICIKGEPQAYDAPQYYEACLFAGSLSKVSYIGISTTPTVNCGRGTPVVLDRGDGYYACLFAGSLSQVGTNMPADCGRGTPIRLAAGDDLGGCRYAGSLSQLRLGSPPTNCGRGVPIQLSAYTNGVVT